MKKISLLFILSILALQPAFAQMDASQVGSAVKAEAVNENLKDSADATKKQAGEPMKVEKKSEHQPFFFTGAAAAIVCISAAVIARKRRAQQQGQK